MAAMSDIRDCQLAVNCGQMKGGWEMHSIFHFVPDDEKPRKYTVRFCSAIVEREFSYHLAKRAFRECARWLAGSTSLHGFPSLHHILYKGCAIRRLQQGGKFQCRELAADEDGKAVPKRVRTLTVPAASECRFRDLAEVADRVRDRSHPPIHFQPQSTTLETVDSFVSREWLFQVTVANRRDVKITGLNRVLGLLREAGDTTQPRLFFVVPEDAFKNGFKGPQPLKTAGGADITADARTEAHQTRQFVLCVPIVVE